MYIIHMCLHFVFVYLYKKIIQINYTYGFILNYIYGYFYFLKYNTIII